MMRKRRKELDAICSQVLKKPCLKETTESEREEADRRRKAELTTESIRAQIAAKGRQVEAAIKAADDFFEAPAVEHAAA